MNPGVPTRVRNAPIARSMAMAWLLLSATVASTSAASSDGPGHRPAATVYVGVEAVVRCVVPHRNGIPVLVGVTDSTAKPASPTPDVRLRIVSRRELDGATELTLGVIASLPGAFDIAPLLRVVSPASDPGAAESSAPPPLPPLRINVWSALPEDHDGRVSEAGIGLRAENSGYPLWLAAVGLLWLTPLGVLVARRMRRPIHDAPAPLPPTPTLADKLRPLIDRVRGGERDPAILAEMERLMLHAMRTQVHASDASVADAMVLVRSDARCGPMLRSLERWLHGPRSERPSDEEVNRLLLPLESLAMSGGGDGSASAQGEVRS